MKITELAQLVNMTTSELREFAPNEFTPDMSDAEEINTETAREILKAVILSNISE